LTIFRKVTNDFKLNMDASEKVNETQENLQRNDADSPSQHEPEEEKEVSFSDPPNSKLVPPRQRASMLPKPEVGPKPTFLRTSPVKRQLPVASGPSSLNLIMTTSLPSPFASSPSPSDSCDSSR
jgi:hypothetical protein